MILTGRWTCLSRCSSKSRFPCTATCSLTPISMVCANIQGFRRWWRRPRSALAPIRRPLILLQPQRHFTHEAGVLAVGEPFGLGGDGGEDVAQGLDLGFRPIAEHV